MSDIRFLDTYSGEKVLFQPQRAPEVGLYTCGPTVYDDAHIGNFRAYLFEDLLRRFLEVQGFKVKHVMNITDVDDKTIEGARRRGVDLDRFTQSYIDAFLEDLETLKVKKAEVLPRATQHIPQMQALIAKLLKKDLAYEKDGSLYYRIRNFPHYGRLSGKDLLQNRAGARVDTDTYEKEQAADFVLWKAAKEGEPAWDSPWGKGRPGWHIECSAMSMTYLGETFDIHAGGEDLIFPHHENEIAQSQGATGEPFVKTWMHCKFLLVDNEKMSKSKGNFYTLRELLAKGASPRAIRYLLLSTHYRKALNFTFEALRAAEQACERLDACLRRALGAFSGVTGNRQLIDSCTAAEQKFWAALSDDLNISDALGELFRFVAEVNRAVDSRPLDQREKKAVAGCLDSVDRVLCVLDRTDEPLERDIEDLLKRREEARNKKDFRRADEIRRAIVQRGYLLEDTREGGVRVRRKKTS